MSVNEEQEDFAARLLVLEREAELVMSELSPGIAHDRLQHIIMIARLLRARLDVASSVIVPPRPPRKGA